MNPRKRAALEAMASQGVSPHEREIARHKLRTMRDDEPEDQGEPWREAWAQQQEHERIAARLAARKTEDAIADIVKRWERGGFSGIKVRVGTDVEQGWDG